jgi:hypothetical protein
MKHNEKNWFKPAAFIFSGVFALFVFPKFASAATLYFSPATGTYEVGQTFNVIVETNSQSAQVNTVETRIVYPTDILDLISVSQGSTFYLPSPGSPAKAPGEAYFGGGAPSPGYTGNAGEAGVLIFQAKAVGSASVSIASGRVLLNDGQGTDAYSGSAGAVFNIIPATVKPPPPPPPPPVNPNPTPNPTPTPTPTPPGGGSSGTDSNSGPVNPTPNPAPANNPFSFAGNTDIKSVAHNLRNLATSPAVSTTVKRAVPIALAIPIADTALNLFSLLATGSESMKIISYLYLFLLQLLGIRKRTKPWGVVYDSASGKPLPAVHIEILNTDSKVLQTTISDLEGRYGFLPLPRSLRDERFKVQFLVEKKNYKFPSKAPLSYTDHIVHPHVYRGGLVSFDSTNFDLPLDPEGKSYAAKKVRVRQPLLGNLFVRVVNVLFWVGLCLVLINYFIDPQLISLLPLIPVLVAGFLRLAGLRLKPFGVVRDKFTKSPLAFSMLVLKNLDGAKETFAVTDQKGRYFMLPKPGKYNLMVYTPNNIEPMRFTEEFVKAKEGWITQKIYI